MRRNTPPKARRTAIYRMGARQPRARRAFLLRTAQFRITVELDYEKTTPNMVSFDPGGTNIASFPQTPSRNYLITWILFSH
jgi:hypothetical protein